jgi:hypothetical protein
MRSESDTSPCPSAPLPGQLPTNGPLHTFFTRTLGFPEDVVMYTLERDHLEELDERLSGFVWQMVGCVVPPTLDLPDYPTYRMGWRPGHLPMVQLQLRHWGVYERVSGIFGEMRWRPGTGVRMTIGGFPPHSTQEDRERMWNALLISYGSRRRGPPRKSVEEKRVLLRLLQEMVQKHFLRYQTFLALRRAAEELAPRLDPDGDTDTRSTETRISRLVKSMGYENWQHFRRVTLERLNQ